MGKIWGKGDFFAKSPPFPMPLSPQKLGGGGVKITIDIWLYTLEKVGVNRRIRDRNSHKCAICCCRDNRKSATSYNGNKRRSVIRRSKNKLQIVILCIEIFNTYIKFADKNSVFSLFFPPPCTQHFWKRGVGKNTFRRKGFSPHLLFSKKQKNYFITTPLAMRYFT